MKLDVLPYDLTMCVVEKIEDIKTDGTFTYVGHALEGHEVLCVTSETPQNTIIRADGWKGITIHGESDDSRTSLAEEISQALTEAEVANLTMRMYEFRLLLVGAENLEKTIRTISSMGYAITVQ